MDLLTLILAAVLSAVASGGAQSPSPTADEARSQIIVTGASSQTPPAPPENHTRAVIIDTGDH